MNLHLRAARRRLVLAYVGVFAVVLAGFASAVAWTITRGLRQQLDASLREVVQRVEEAVPDFARARSAGDLQATLSALAVPDRQVFLVDAVGSIEFPLDAPPWVVEVARATGPTGELFGTVEFEDHDLRYYAKRMGVWTVIASADFVEVEDRYPQVFGGFGAAALAAMLLVGLGGSVLASKSVKQADVAFSRLRQFTADAAHELRTPVSVIQAQVDVALQRPRTGDEYREALRGIAGEAGRLGGIVEKLLQLARTDAGEWPSKLSPIFLDDQVSDLAAAITSLAEERGVNVDILVHDECPVLGDPELVQQLIMILADNAIQFTPTGGRVEVAAVRQGARSELVVTDSGPGIPEEHLGSVFDRFVRVEPGRPRAGAGLGLSIARWISEVHGAHISLANRPEGGAVARVVFEDRPPPDVEKLTG